MPDAPTPTATIADVALDFARDTAELNRRRLRVLLPLMAAIHAYHVAHFRVAAGARAALSRDALLWHDALVAVHGLMIPLALLLGLAAWRGQGRRYAAHLGAVTAGLYLVHGAVCTGLDQLVVANATAYVGYCFGSAVAVYLRPRETAAVYAAGAAALLGSVVATQRSSEALTAIVPNCVTLTLLSAALSALVFANHRRDFAQRQTIGRQREELGRLNADLERRVREQVSVIVARAAEVDRLNLQLQAQVRERSVELSRALARLARDRDDDGTLRDGAVLGGRFVVERCVGVGGMGAVYRGVDQTTGARVAIKVIQTTSAAQLGTLRRFIREAESTATVTHPAVVRMIHVDVSDDGMLFQVQEFVEGEALGRYLRVPWRPGSAARLTAVLCDALAAAHAQGVVHRDVKPDNVMLTHDSPGLKLVDFGIASLLDAASSGDEDTRAGTILGTPGYMAPEQIEAREPVTDRADVYAVGVVLFRLLSGRLPFTAMNSAQMVMHHLATPAPDVRDVEATVPDALAELLARCLRKHPRDRPSASELAATLGAFADAVGAGTIESLRTSASLALEPTVHARPPRA